jgi:beta-phosphoglucomutase-like phosphatase (HAD superfamily)
MASTALIIFDHDGVITHNSEMIYAESFSQNLAREGHTATPRELLDLLTGLSSSEIVPAIQGRFGFTLTKEFNLAVNREQTNMLTGSLRASAHVEAVLDAVRDDYRLPYCIASNAPQRVLDVTIPAMKLTHHFNERNVFSSHHTEHNKTKLYHLLFNFYGVPAEQCLVIEDSTHGVRLAKGAGIDNIVGYAGAEHITDRAAHAAALKREGVGTVIEHFRDFPYHLLKP